MRHCDAYFNSEDPQVNAPLRRNILAQLDVPIREVDEMLPAVMTVQGKINLHKRAPFGALGLAHQVHVGLVRGPIGLVRIAFDAGADDVFPRRRAAAIPRHDVIQVEVFAVKDFAAVLAGVLVPLENVMPGEFDFFLRHPVVHEEQDDAGYTDAEGDAVDGFIVRGVGGNIAPFGKIQGAKRAVGIVQNDLCVALKEESESPAGGADIDCLPEPV